MESILHFIDSFLHLDIHLKAITNEYGLLIYLLLFATVFSETGFVLTPFLPGDSLIFATGTLAASGSLNLSIIRTFAPFVAGVGIMPYSKFICYNVIGGIGWVSTFLLGGYFFGNLSVVKDNFSFVILGIILVSLLPGVITYFQGKRDSNNDIIN